RDCLSCITYHSVSCHCSSSTDSYSLSLHDALPIFVHFFLCASFLNAELANTLPTFSYVIAHMYSLQSQNFGGSEVGDRGKKAVRSEEHTSELQSRFDLVCRLLLEKKKVDKVKSYMK